MMEAKDWLSFFIGLIVTAGGLLPLLNSKMGVGPSWFAFPFLTANIAIYIVAAAGLYLIVNSFIEITNSNAIGWLSFLIAALFAAVGIMKVLGTMSIGLAWFALTFVSQTFLLIALTLEGVFLIIACFAMEM